MTRRSIAKDAQPRSPVYQSYNEGGGRRRAARDGVQEGDDEVLVDELVVVFGEGADGVPFVCVSLHHVLFDRFAIIHGGVYYC